MQSRKGYVAFDNPRVIMTKDRLTLNKLIVFLQTKFNFYIEFFFIFKFC